MKKNPQKTHKKRKLESWKEREIRTIKEANPELNKSLKIYIKSLEQDNE